MDGSPTRGMSTADMLGEIGVGTAAEAVMAARYITSPPGPTFIPELDKLLLEARAHPGGSALQRGDLVEIVGPSGSGKTSLAVFLVMTTILPPSLTFFLPGHLSVVVPLGGRGMRAALLSPPSHAPGGRAIEAAMRAHIDQCLGLAGYDARSPSVEESVDLAVAKALMQVTVIRPRPRALGWTLALRRLLKPPELILSRGTDLPEDVAGSLDLVVCDGFSDGFWPERWVEEERGAGNKERRNLDGVRGPDDVGMGDVWSAVTALRRDAGAVVVLTVQGLRPISGSPFFKPHLPRPYPSPFNTEADSPLPSPWPLNIQLTLLGRTPPLQFPPETTLVEALRARTHTDIQVLNAILRVPGGRGLPGTLGGARWTFGVVEQGLVPFVPDDEPS